MPDTTKEPASTSSPVSPSASCEKEECRLMFADWENPVFDGPPDREPPLRGLNTEADE